MNKLAIVIPAFKAEWFALTLQSLADQTDKNFNVYIGDDNSPDNLEPIVKVYCRKLNLKYVKFKENMGSESIVKQWERCITLAENEPWIWLIGDDDLIDNKCVEHFYKELEKCNGFDLYRFNMRVIDPQGNKLFDAPRFPEEETGWEFIEARLKWERSNALCPYIFSRNVYIEKQGFTEFDLGWCSDDATWLKFSEEKGIKTIYGPEVSWRYGANISSDFSLIDRKINSWIKYSNWLLHYSKRGISERSEFTRLLKHWVIRNVYYSGGRKSMKIFKNKLRNSSSSFKLDWNDFLYYLKV